MKSQSLLVAPLRVTLVGKPPTLIGADLSPLGLFVPFFRYSCATLHFLPLRLRPQGSPRHPLSKNPIKKRSVFTPKSRSILRPRIFGEFSENFQEPFSAEYSSNFADLQRLFQPLPHFHTRTTTSPPSPSDVCTFTLSTSSTSTRDSAAILD